MAQNEYSDSLLDDFDGVEDTDLSIDDLDDVFEEDKVEETPVEEPVKETSDNKSLDDLSLEELESMLDDEVVEEITTETPEANKGDLNVAVHQERQKNKNLKTSNDLLNQQVELIKQELELLKLNNAQPNQNVALNIPIDEVDILAGVSDDDVITKADMLKLLQQKEQKNEQNRIEQEVINNNAKAQVLINEFKGSHGADLGILSFDNVDKLVINGKVQLTQGQQLDIANAVKNGKDPAKLYYDTVVNSLPALSRKKYEMDIKRAIQKKKVSAPTDNVVSQPFVEDDFSNNNRATDLDSHLDSLC
jgi:hypothetical protein